MRTRSRTLYLLGMILASAIAYLIWDMQRPQHQTLMTVAGHPDRVEISFGGHRIEARLNGKNWELTEADDQALCDQRVNIPFLEHILELVSSLRNHRAEEIAPEHAAEYGIAAPVLAVSVGYKDQEDAVLFGRRDLSNQNAFAFFVKKNLVTLVPATTLDLVDGKTALALSGSRLARATADDVMQLDVSGPKCKTRRLKRDGDGWTEENRRARAADKWVDRLFSLPVEPQKLKNPPKLQPICTLSIVTVSRAKETISVLPGGYVDSGTGCIRNAPRLLELISNP